MAYEAKQEQAPDDLNLTLGRMRCMEALSEWYVMIGRFYLRISLLRARLGGLFRVRTEPRF